MMRGRVRKLDNFKQLQRCLHETELQVDSTRRTSEVEALLIRNWPFQLHERCVLPLWQIFVHASVMFIAGRVHGRAWTERMGVRQKHATDTGCPASELQGHVGARLA